jgi:hypothetical protein
MDELTGKSETSGTWQSGTAKNLQGKSGRIARGKPLDYGLQHLDQDLSVMPDLNEQLLLIRNHLTASVTANKHCKRPSALQLFMKGVSNKVKQTQSVMILNVENTAQNNLKFFIWGWLNPPCAGDEASSTIPVGGWILGRTSQPTTIRFTVEQEVIAETLINVPRPDVMKAYSIQTSVCGYNTILNPEILPNRGKIILQAIFPDGNSSVAGTIDFIKLK